MSKITIHDVASNRLIEREMTDDEISAVEKLQAEEKVALAQAETNNKAKEQARAAVLAKLGLTADEAAALLG
jgi:hypothetical protein